MKKPLPPLQGLYCFYLAADMGSFKEAAAFLNVTAAAMSQQIRQLEDRLNLKLFQREHRKVHLTADGNLLFESVKIGFEALQNGVRRVSQDPNPTSLSLSVLPSFGQHWLVPRLGSFTEQKPELSVLLATDNHLVNFQQDKTDLCVRFGTGTYPGLQAEFLMADHLYPVAHPLYLEKHDIKSLDDLTRAVLIEDSRPDMSWEYWLKVTGLGKGAIKPSIRYHGAHMVLEGALAGQGVALVRHSLAWKFIQQGLISRISNIEVKSSFNYYLVAPPAYFKRDKIQHFNYWIQQEAKNFWQQSQETLGKDRIIIEGLIEIEDP